MADLLSFFPVFQENIQTVRHRLDVDANAGLDPADPAYLDTTEGGIYWDITQAVALEIERLWDSLSVEIPAAMFVAFAWGIYLDAHGVTVGLTRKSPVAATGAVTFTGVEGTLIATGTQVATIQTDPDADPLEFETLASATIDSSLSVDIQVQAITPGSTGNVEAGTITTLLSPVSGVSAVTNADALTGGADREGDTAFRARILLEYSQPHGAGTVADYQRWALAYDPIGFVTVEPIWDGPGTVRVIVTDQSNNPVSTTVVDGLQALLDPVAGLGHGLAPIGAIVTVATPATVVVDVAATLNLLSGYTIDGAGGTIAVEPDVEDAITTYINSLAPGEDVILEHVKAQMFGVEGVYDVISTTLNTVAANLSIASLEVATTGTIALT